MEQTRSPASFPRASSRGESEGQNVGCANNVLLSHCLPQQVCGGMRVDTRVRHVVECIGEFQALL